MIAVGPWAWWNQYGSVPVATCIARARQVRGVIVKAGWWAQFDAFKAAGIPVAVERYVFPANVSGEIAYLAAGLDRGARFAVINAEVEWEALPDESAMMRLINGVRAAHPGVELYASIDSRGNRTRAPALRALIRECTGVFPEVYPKAFRPSMPPGAVAAAFVDSVDHGSFQGKPVLPSLQTYDNIGAAAVDEQIAQCKRGATGATAYPGWQAYTIAHASDAEWAAFIAGIPAASAAPAQEEDDMAVPYVEPIPAQPAYRRYMIIDGKLVWCASEAQQRAFVKAGYIVLPPIGVPLADLVTIPLAPGTSSPTAPW